MKISKSKFFEVLEDKRIVVNGYGFKEIWRCWGHPDGFGVEGAERDEVTQEIRPLFMNQVISHFDDDLIARSSIRDSSVPEPLKRVALSIPQEILNIVYCFPHWRIECVQIAEHHPEQFIQLTQINPTLVLLLARELASNPLWSVKHFGGLLLMKQSYIARELGYRSDIVSYFRKFSDISLCSCQYMDLAIKAWKETKIRKLLRHVKSINLNVILLGFYHPDVVEKCPSLLHVAANSDHHVLDATIYEEVEAIVQRRILMQLHYWPWGEIHSVDQLIKIRRKVDLQAIKLGNLPAVEYPSPPLTLLENWDWIADDHELTKFAEEYDNCAVLYHWRCLSGQSVIYINRYEAIIVVLNKNGNKWVVSDVLGPSNSVINTSQELDIRKQFEEKLNENT